MYFSYENGQPVHDVTINSGWMITQVQSILDESGRSMTEEQITDLIFRPDYYFEFLVKQPSNHLIGILLCDRNVDAQSATLDFIGVRKLARGHKLGHRLLMSCVERSVPCGSHFSIKWTPEEGTTEVTRTIMRKLGFTHPSCDGVSSWFQAFLHTPDEYNQPLIRGGLI